MQMTFRSQLRNVFLAKIWGPLLCVGGSLLVFREDFPSWRFLLASPFLIAALFGASLAILEVDGGLLRYRRLFKWTIIPENEVVSARVELPPVIGSIRLTKFLFPWGRLYFVLDSNSDPNPFREGRYGLVSSIGKADRESTKSNRPKDSVQKLKLVIAVMAGGFYYSFSRLIFPAWASRRVEFSQPANAHEPTLIRIPQEIVRLFGNFEIVLVVSAAFVLLAIWRYRRPDAWIFAFLVGVSLPHIFLHWL